LEKYIDLNLDAGESEADLRSGKEEALYRLVSSVNIACGGHAGTESSMRMAVDLALKYGLAIGAHPSYPDLEGFGRRKIEIAADQLKESIQTQIQSLRKICAEAGTQIQHVKPHGALYNAAAVDTGLAEVVIEAVAEIDPQLILVELADSVFLRSCRARGVRCAAEGFVDRRYEPSGNLRARIHSDAHVHDPQEAAAQALLLAQGQEIRAFDGSGLKLSVDTLCIHGDRADALLIANEVRAALDRAGVRVRSLRI
jgi:5-oxoprolinase (ATP-hydrolysing) subunit A